MHNLITLLLDIILGEPQSSIHPTVWIGRYIAFLEKALYVKNGLKARFAGAVLTLLVTLTAVITGFLAQNAFYEHLTAPWAGFATAIVASLTIACRSLISHARPVLKQLASFNILSARKFLARIVGRDTGMLNRSEISRACVETVAEGLGDGIVSPLFFFALFGLPGAFAYRAVNTMDSMIGHKNERYFYFGWASARLDDVMNYLPTRLCAFPSIVLSSLFVTGRMSEAFKTAIKYHSAHHSPNAGWLEASTAGALGVKLGGTNYYDGEKSEYPIMNENGRKARPSDIKKTMKIVVLSAFFSALELDIIFSLFKIF